MSGDRCIVCVYDYYMYRGKCVQYLYNVGNIFVFHIHYGVMEERITRITPYGCFDLI